MTKSSVINKYDCLRNLTDTVYIVDQKLDPNFVDTIRFVYVYDVTHTRAFIATKSDQTDQKLYFMCQKFADNKNWTIILIESQLMSKKSIIKISTNASFFGANESNNCVEFIVYLALDGQIFGQTFDKSCLELSAIFEIDSLWSPKCSLLVSFRKICCAKTMLLALNGIGYVYWWRFDDISQTESVDPIKRRLGSRCFGSEVIVQISCSTTHCLTLSDEGSVFFWPQITPKDKSVVSSITKLAIVGNPFISRLCCGLYQNMFLSRTGDIYITSGGMTRVETLPNVNEKFTEIDASKECDISMGLQKSDGLCYIWGEVDNRMVTEPEQTPFKSIEDAFAHYLQVNNKTIYF